MSINSALLFPFIVFCSVTLFTPGPNNVMLMTTGLNFGLRRTLLPMLGVAFGFSFLVLCVSLGLGAVFARYPVIYMILKYASGLYLLYLAYTIAKSEPTQATDTPKRKEPMSFFQAVGFQWVNPKGWVMATGAAATYTAVANYPYNMLLIASLFGFLGLGSSFTWAALGSFLQRFLHRPKILRTFNIVMAFLLVASLYPILRD